MSAINLYDAEHEKAVLGCCLAQPHEVMAEVMDSLVAEDFFVAAHQTIFGVMVSLFHAKKVIGAMEVHAALGKRAEECGSPGILAEVYTSFATHLNVASYVRMVKEKSLLRCLQTACAAIVKDIAEMPDSVASVLDRAESSILRVTHSLDTKAQISRVEDAVGRWMAQQSKVQVGEVQSRLATGFREFDALNGGLMPGAVHVIAARPGQGKTDFMFTVLRNVARRGIPVGIIQLEMTEGMMIERLMSDEAGIDSRRFHAPMTLLEWDKLYQAEINSQKWPMHLECAFGVDVNGLRKSVRKLVILGCKVLMIDYLQLLNSMETKYGNREQALAEVSRTLAGFAVEFEIPILVGSQLNRLDVGGKQGLHNLRESDSVGNDARVVVILRKKNPEDASTSPQMIVDVVKYSNGATGELVMIFDMPHHRYADFQNQTKPLAYDDNH